MTALTKEEILTAKEVADLLAVNPTTVVRLAKRGELPAFRIGRLRRFRQSDLNDKLVAGRQFKARQPIDEKDS